MSVAITLMSRLILPCVTSPQDRGGNALSVRYLGVALVATCLAAIAVPVASARADDDPPSRVGRLAVIDGTVSFHTADQTTWGAATPNYPITTGNALWADNGAHAAVQLGANDINLGSQTELDIDRLDDQTFQASLPQGNLYLNLRGLNSGDQYQIATPRGTVSIAQPGRYEISSGDQTHPGTVTVLEGGAQVTGDNINLSVGAGQSGVLSDNGQGGPVQAVLAPAQGEDDLIAWARSREPQAAPPQAAAAMTGTQDLGNYGNWSTSPDYGNVWYPQVAADWVPYRSGRWAWVAPWGWTWVDDAPWGFAPFHYGRWVQIGPRWAWAPRPIVVAGPVVPIYAPALVSFVGDVAGVGIGISIGGPSVGWVPLGPREVYYPPYRVSDRYARRVNVTYVKNVNVINVHNTTVINNVTANHFANHGAVTVVSRDTMIQSRGVSGSVEHVNESDLAKMHGFAGGHAPLQPTARTAGLTPGEAQHYGVSPKELHGKAAAGPKIEQGNNRNWAKFSPPANNNNLQAKDHQNGGQQGASNNRWANQGPRKPGSPVQQKQQWTTNNSKQNNGQQVNVQPSRAQQQNQKQALPSKQPLPNNQATQVTHQPQDNGGQAQQGKWNWANNNQSRQPGAAVTQKHDNLQQNGQQGGKPVGGNGQAAIQSSGKEQPSNQTLPPKSTNNQKQHSQDQLKAQAQQLHTQQQQWQQNAERQRQNTDRQNIQRQNTQRQNEQSQAQKQQLHQEQQHQAQQQQQSARQSNEKKPAPQAQPVQPQ